MNDTMDTILGKIASPDNAYGGGGVSALAGSLGTALARMVCHLQERKAEPALQTEYASLLDQLSSLENRLIGLFEEDARSFEPLQAMYKVRPQTDEEKRDKASRMEALLEQAAQTPLDIMETGCAALRLLDRLGRYLPEASHQRHRHCGLVVPHLCQGCGIQRRDQRRDDPGSGSCGPAFRTA